MGGRIIPAAHTARGSRGRRAIDLGRGPARQVFYGGRLRFRRAMGIFSKKKKGRGQFASMRRPWVTSARTASRSAGSSPARRAARIIR